MRRLKASFEMVVAQRLRYWLWIGLLGLGATAARAEPAGFVPDTIWRDTQGNPINAHGGCVVFFKGVYYWYGEHKIAGKAEVAAADGGVHCYSSTNLYSWTDQGIVLSVDYANLQSDIAYGCVLERPKVLFDGTARSFVMLFKLYLRGNGYETGFVGVAAAPSPIGPFAYRGKFLGAGSDRGSGDFAIFQAADGSTYHLTVRKPDRVFCAGKLANDFLKPEGGYRPLSGVVPETEAPAIVHYRGKYYLLGSGSSGWAPNAARSYVADDIFGPWRATGNPCIGFNPYTGMGADRTFGAQISFIFPVAGKDGEFIAMFDVWKPERAEAGRYVWLPLTLENGKPIIQWHDQWDLSLFAREK
jgi:hypothetical protein